YPCFCSCFFPLCAGRALIRFSSNVGRSHRRNHFNSIYNAAYLFRRPNVGADRWEWRRQVPGLCAPFLLKKLSDASSPDRSILNFASYVIHRSRVLRVSYVPREGILAGDSSGCYQRRRDDNAYRHDFQTISAFICHPVLTKKKKFFLQRRKSTSYLV
ncbi:unnamed protein product, partial [Laminaria digitata]